MCYSNLLRCSINFPQAISVRPFGPAVNSWRREWDSNPRVSCPTLGFRDQPGMTTSVSLQGIMEAQTSFKDRVLEEVRKIPKGSVASYGQIALFAGKPRGAREVGWILNRWGDDGITPWWRIINAKGYISIKHNEISALEQKRLLENDGIEVGKNFSVSKSYFI
ncbi:MAG: Protein containing Methylated-DNA-[protein]-cysteine S-methyltransferase [candidate division WWE3 bacterium GW2011_GWB1_42_41]|nr:MAG: Protein containing Methylated-DNA-[protein]-cysteine S-methyltransferase [candidate division WWE3 bacterium GW2011_GWB1_42_41]